MPRKEVRQRAAARGALRAVKPGEAAPPKKPAPPKTVAQAAASGDQLALLESMQTRIAKTVDDPHTPARDLAALTRRLHEIAKDIAAIRAAAEGDDVADAADTPDEEFNGTDGV